MLKKWEGGRKKRKTREEEGRDGGSAYIWCINKIAIRKIKEWVFPYKTVYFSVIKVKLLRDNQSLST